jgi:hypothetical protein
MTLNIKNSCDHIVNSVRDSLLNYSIQETPFFIYLTIRKSFSKAKQFDEVPAFSSIYKHSDKLETLRMKLKKRWKRFQNKFKKQT